MGDTDLEVTEGAANHLHAGLILVPLEPRNTTVSPSLVLKTGSGSEEHVESSRTGLFDGCDGDVHLVHEAVGTDVDARMGQSGDDAPDLCLKMVKLDGRYVQLTDSILVELMDLLSLSAVVLEVGADMPLVGQDLIEVGLESELSFPLNMSPIGSKTEVSMA